MNETARLGQGMRATVGKAIARAALVSAFALLGIFPFVADYIVLLAGIAGLVTAIWMRDAVLLSPPALLIFLALAALLATLPFVYQAPADLVPPAAILLLLVTPGLAFFIARDELAIHPLAIHVLCLIGVSLALLAGAGEFLITGSTRVGVGNNPIHYAALSVMLGFLAAPGVGSTTSRWRIVFLLGPAMAVAVTLLSGSRGPLLAALILSLVLAAVLLVWFRRDRLVMLTMLGVVLLGAAGLSILSTSGRALSIVDALAQVAAGRQAPIDDYRLAMYRMAWQVLTTSPWHGLGFGQVMPALTAATPELVYMYSLENLHSDPANFVAAAGLPGLLAYAMLLIAPLTLWRRGQRRLNMTIILLTSGQLALGLTNTTFGILPQTMLYVTALGYCLALALSTRREERRGISSATVEKLAAGHVSG